MSYSCTDFTDSILDALGIDVPEESWDSPSDQADLALAEIQRLQKAAPNPGSTPAEAARAALCHLREAYRLLSKAPRTRERVRLAITSAGGAVRHAESRRWRQP